MNNNWSTGNCEIERFNCETITYLYGSASVSMDETRFVRYDPTEKKFGVFNRWTRQLEKVIKHFIN